MLVQTKVHHADHFVIYVHDPTRALLRFVHYCRSLLIFWNFWNFWKELRLKSDKVKTFMIILLQDHEFVN